MAIIYSYPQVVQPALSDLLVGTDVSTKNKVTKSFSIQSIVDLVETAVPGGGTVTSIDTNSSTFITLSGGPISTTGTITASLSATGVPTSTKFLRGDNTWATPPGGTDTTYTISSAQNGSAANIRLTGSDGGQNIVTLIAGANITLTDNGSNAITIASTASGGGGACCSVNAGNGLKIESGTPASNPVIGVDYVGSNNFILKGQSQTTITEQDYIPFNDISSGSVKTTTMGVIPPSALSLVKQYIDAGDANDVTNSSDSFTTTAKVQKIVSLTSAEYASITPDANTLYLIVGALPTFTATLAFTNTISGTEYTIGGDQAGSTQEGISGSSYAFNTTISPNPGFFFSSGPTVTNAVGTITTNETVYTLLSGTVEAIPTPQCTATLFVNTSGITGSQFTLGGDLSGAQETGDCPLDITGLFNTTITANAGFQFTTGPVIENATGVISGDQVVETCITGVIEAIAPPPVTVTASLNLSNLTGVSGEVSGSVTPGSYSGDSPLAYSFTPSVTASTGYSIENLTFTGDLSGTATQSKTAVIYANGNVVADPVDAVVQLSINDQITGGSEGVAYDLSGNLTGTTQSGPVPFSYAFNTYVTVRPNWEFTSGPTVQNASGTTSQEGLQTVTTVITGSVQEIVTPVTATLNVIENISGSQVYSITGDQDDATQSGAPDFTYSFTTGVSIPSGYEWTDGPDITPTQPNVGTISTNTTVNTTISGVIEPIEGTVNLAFSNNVNGFENTTTALGASTSITGPVGDPYTFTNSITADPGYEFTSPAVWTPSSIITGTIAAGTTNITQSVSGTVTAIAVPQYYALQKCATGGSGFTTNLNTDQLTLSTGDIVVDTAPNPDEYYTVLADRPTVQGSTFVSSTGLNNCPAPLYYWNAVQCSGTGTVKISTTDALVGPGDSYTFNSVCYKIVDTDVSQTPAYNIDTFSGCCTGTVNVDFTNNVVGKENTTTLISDGGTASTSGDVGTSYNIANSITANNGYEFTAGPTWSTGGTGDVSGTFTSGVTGISQSVTGTVVLTQYYALQKCSTGGSGFTTNLSVGQLTLSTNDIVLDTGEGVYYRVLSGRPTTQGSVFVDLTALNDCPTPLYYYESVQCSGTGTARVSSEDPNLTSADSYTYNSVCYEIVGSDPTQNPSYDITGLVDGCCTATLTSFTTTSIAQSTGADACSQPKTQTRSHDGSGALPTTGDTVYLGSTIGSGNVGAGFWGLTNDTYYQTNSSGLVTSVQACPVVNGTVNLTVTNQVFNSSYTVNPASQTITGQVGDPYTFTTTVVPYSGYELVPGTIEYNGLPNGIQSGTISAGTTEITQTITGQTRLLEYYTLTKCDPNGGPGFVSFVDIYDSINGTVANPPLSNGDTVYDAGNDYYYTVTGTTPTQGSTGLSSYTGGTGCPAPLYYYNVVQCSGTGTDKVSSEVPNLTSDYSYTYNSVCYKIVDTDPTQTPSYDITSLPSGCCTATVNVNFTNSVSGKANTTTTIADGGTASATGPVGTSYSITNSISANSGYEFTSGPTWSTGGTGTVTGTFTSGTTNISQDVTGTVTASGTTVYTQQITAEEDGGFGTPSTTAAAAKTELCFQFLPFSAYSEDANITDAIQLNARWFADSGGSNPFSGGFKWYGVGTPEDLGAVYIIRISDAGIVTETTTAC